MSSDCAFSIIKYRDVDEKHIFNENIDPIGAESEKSNKKRNKEFRFRSKKLHPYLSAYCFSL